MSVYLILLQVCTVDKQSFQGHDTLLFILILWIGTGMPNFNLMWQGYDNIIMECRDSIYQLKFCWCNSLVAIMGLVFIFFYNCGFTDCFKGTHSVTTAGLYHSSYVPFLNLPSGAYSCGCGVYILWVLPYTSHAYLFWVPKCSHARGEMYSQSKWPGKVWPLPCVYWPISAINMLKFLINTRKMHCNNWGWGGKQMFRFWI